MEVRLKVELGDASLRLFLLEHGGELKVGFEFAIPVLFFVWGSVEVGG